MTWIDLKDYEQYYQICKEGFVRGKDRYVKGKNSSKLLKKGKILVSRPHSGGYHYVQLTINSKEKNLTLHRLLAQHFIPNPENKPFVNHKNGIKTDNRLENLEWCTGSENMRHAYDTGLEVGRKGISHHMAKLNEAQVISIRARLGLGEIEADLAREFNLNPMTINSIKRRKTWTHI